MNRLNKTTFVASLSMLAAAVSAAEAPTSSVVPELPLVPQLLSAPAVPFYNRMIIDDVKISYNENNSYAGLKPQQLAKLNAAAGEAVRAAVGRRYEVVTEPDVGVLRVSIAITDVRADKKAKRFWSYTPFGFVKGRIDTAAARDFVLEWATVEVRLYDSVSGRQLAAVADFTNDGLSGETLSFRTLIAKVGEWTQRLSAEISQPAGLRASVL